RRDARRNVRSTRDISPSARGGDLRGSDARRALARRGPRTLPVAVPHDRRLDYKPTVQPPPPALPSFLVLECLFGERGRLPHTVRSTELDRQLGGSSADPVPRRAEGKLVRDRADAAGVDVDRESHAREDRS